MYFASSHCLPVPVLLALQWFVLVCGTLAATGAAQANDIVDAGTTSAETCTTRDDATCMNSSRTLFWRAQPYDKDGRELYGGEYAAATFAEHFTGPVSGHDWDVLFTKTGQANTLAQKDLPPRKVRLVSDCGYFKAAGQKCHFCGHTRRVWKALAHDKVRRERFSYLVTYMLKDREQFEQWRQEARKNPQRAWVYKPCSNGMSAGIRLLHGQELLDFVEKGQPQVWSVAQEYIQHPFLGFGGRKFHLRVYVLVAEWQYPQSVLVFNEGILFRSRHKYKPTEVSAKRDVFSSISENVEGLPHAAFWDWLDAAAANSGGSLPNSTSVREHMVDVIREIFVAGDSLHKSFGSSDQLLGRGFNCFDFYGLDVMLDESLKPYVLEVNTGPNMDISDRGEENTPLLQAVKAPLVQQLVHWMALRVKRAPLSYSEAIKTDNEALLNFTRVL